VAEPGDVVISLGAGDINRVLAKVEQELLATLAKG
jgi:UDP-N-acetylmuramate-alanine ligase